MNEPVDEGVSKELANRGADYVASAAKAVLGVVPFVGSLLAEIAGTVIPNQRVDRIVKFAEILDQKISQLKVDFVRSQITNENFTDLVEEGLRQAARSLSDERREYIASLIANSLTSEDVEFAESKHLLRVLGELNDIEVIWLRFYLVPAMDRDIEFREKHKKTLDPVPATVNSSRAELDKWALQKSYKEHLIALGLLHRRTEIVTGRKGAELKDKGYELAPLGRLLLRHIGLWTDWGGASDPGVK